MRIPLVGKDMLPEKAGEVFQMLKNKGLYVSYDDKGSIGKRYARADEVGIPYCITVDYDTQKDDTVTVRERDSKQQIRTRVDDVPEYLTQTKNK